MLFEKVQRIVYSTCSVHEEENEQVVQWALENCNGQFTVRMVFEEWPQRGAAGYAFSESVLRVNNENTQNLQGFFVACLERKGFETIENAKTECNHSKGRKRHRIALNAE